MREEDLRTATRFEKVSPFAENNRLFVRGEICANPIFSHENHGEGFYKSCIRTMRLSGTPDYINLMISELLIHDAKKKWINLRCGALVKVRGELRTYKNMVDGIERTRLFMIVNEITAQDYKEVLAGIDINDLYLEGEICKLGQMRETRQGKLITEFFLCVKRSVRAEKACYFPCIAWGGVARFASNLSVGAKVAVFGRLQSREYEKTGNDGEVRIMRTSEVSLWRMGKIE